MLFEKHIILSFLIGVLAGGPQASKPLKSDLRGGHIGAQETIETAIGIPLWIFLHQKDKLENKIKQDHFK